MLRVRNALPLSVSKTWCVYNSCVPIYLLAHGISHKVHIQAFNCAFFWSHRLDICHFAHSYIYALLNLPRGIHQAWTLKAQDVSSFDMGGKEECHNGWFYGRSCQTISCETEKVCTLPDDVLQYHGWIFISSSWLLLANLWSDWKTVSIRPFFTRSLEPQIFQEVQRYSLKTIQNKSC